MPPLSPLTEFALLARMPDDALDLERLAVAIARMGDPGVDAAAVARTLDDLAARIDDAVDRGAPDRLAASLARAIVGTLGFQGSQDVFGDADASFLDRVLERRTGLPILLAVVWILLGKRLGVPIAGVNFPGHFLACVDAPGARIYVDPFRGGATVDVRTLLERLGPSHDARAALEPAGTRAVVVRMLVNLKHLWVDRRELERALGAVDRILLVGGELPPHLRDRGLLSLRLERTAEGVRDLRRYLALAPGAPDRDAIEGILARHGES